MMYFSRFAGVSTWTKTDKSAFIARQAARRLALAGLLDDLRQGTYNIFFQSCIFRIEYKTLRFDSAYRLTALGNELFEALHGGAAKIRSAHRDLTREQVRSVSGEVDAKALDTLERLESHVSKEQFEEIGRFVNEQIDGRCITRMGVLRFFRELVMRPDWIGIDENEFSDSWEAMYHEAIAIESRGVSRGYRIENKLTERLEKQTTDIDRTIVAEAIAAARRARR
jgi:hypothetical protein